MIALLLDGYWFSVSKADPRARALYLRHYSSTGRRHHHQWQQHAITGPGETMVLLTPAADALFAWYRGIVANGEQQGVMCSIFRNEGPVLSSVLIREAMALAWARWPGERLFTYVWDARVQSANPGYCFKQAGWRTCGRNKDGRLTILECLPASALELAA